MRVKVTAMFEYGDKSITKETGDFDIEDIEEARNYLIENLVEPYADDDGHLLEDDPEEPPNDEYLAVWILADPLDSRDEVVEFLDQCITDTEALLGEL